MLSLDSSPGGLVIDDSLVVVLKYNLYCALGAPIMYLLSSILYLNDA